MNGHIAAGSTFVVSIQTKTKSSSGFYYNFSGTWALLGPVKSGEIRGDMWPVLIRASLHVLNNQTVHVRLPIFSHVISLAPPPPCLLFCLTTNYVRQAGVRLICCDPVPGDLDHNRNTSGGRLLAICSGLLILVG